MARRYNLFISHSWSYGDAYDKLTSFFDSYPYFLYKNYSIPKDDPIHNAPNAAALTAAIKRQISPCSAIIIMAGKYATYSKWINSEISIALELDKPILAVKPRGNLQASSVVVDAADAIVGWNSISIVDGIKEISI